MYNNKYIASTAKTWGLPIERANKVLETIKSTITDPMFQNITIGQAVNLLEALFEKKEEKLCAVFEFGKLVGITKVRKYYEKDIKENPIESFIKITKEAIQ